MAKSALVRIDGKTFHVLKECKLRTGVPFNRQIHDHVLGKACKIKKLGEYS